MEPHLAAKVSGAWDRGRVARSTSPEAGFRSLQVGVANSVGTAVVALFSYPLHQQCHSAADGKSRVHRSGAIHQLVEGDALFVELARLKQQHPARTCVDQGPAGRDGEAVEPCAIRSQQVELVGCKVSPGVRRDQHAAIR